MNNKIKMAISTILISSSLSAASWFFSAEPQKDESIQTTLSKLAIENHLDDKIIAEIKTQLDSNSPIELIVQNALEIADLSKQVAKGKEAILSYTQQLKHLEEAKTQLELESSALKAEKSSLEKVVETLKGEECALDEKEEILEGLVESYQKSAEEAIKEERKLEKRDSFLTDVVESQNAEIDALKAEKSNNHGIFGLLS